VAKSISASELPNQIRQLLEQRRQHTNAISQIDQTLASVIAALDGTAAAPAPLLVIEQAALTPRERQTLRHLLYGRSEKAVAKLMGLSTGSVSHIHEKRVPQISCEFAGDADGDLFG